MEITIYNRRIGQTDRVFVRSAGLPDPRWVEIVWCDPDRQITANQPPDCYGWLDGGILFLPADARADWNQIGEDGLPDPDAGWYEPTSGRSAVIGLAGIPLSVL